MTLTNKRVRSGNFLCPTRENKANVLVNQQKVQTNVETGNRPEFLMKFDEINDDIFTNFRI